MFNFKNEVERTIIDNNLKFINIAGSEKEQFLNKLHGIFVYGNPRALWSKFKYKPISIDYKESIENELLKIIPKETDIYFIIDNYNHDYHIYKANIADVYIFITECIGLDEYYIIYDDFTKLICENDHGELLFIDTVNNEKK